MEKCKHVTTRMNSTVHRKLTDMLLDDKISKDTYDKNYEGLLLRFPKRKKNAVTFARVVFKSIVKT